MIKQITLLIGFLFVFAHCFSQETFKALNSEGNRALDAGDYQKALSCFDKALNMGYESKPEITWTAMLAASCAMQLGLEEKTLYYNNIAIQNGCTDRIVIEQQLELCEKLNDQETKEQVLLYARDLENNYRKYTLKLLYHYHNTRQFEKTIAATDQFLEITPGHFNARYFKAVALLKTGNEKEALTTFEQLLAEEPDNTKVLLQLGLIHYNRASAIFDKANRKYNSKPAPTRLDYHNYRQEIKPALDDYRACIPYFEKYQETESKQSIADAIKLAKSRMKQVLQE